MPIGILFWVIYVLAAVVVLWSNFDGGPLGYRRVSGSIVFWILVGILGWHVFGPVVR